MKKIINQIKDSLDISTREAKSILAFLSLAFLTFLIFKVADYYTSQKESKVIIERIAPEIPEIEKTTPVPKAEQSTTSKRFTFNPNRANKDELLSLGFPSFIANNIIKYREKGGSFKVKNDLLKIYNMPVDLFNELYSYIDLPEIKANRDDYRIAEGFQEENEEIPVKVSEIPTTPALSDFDLNKADTNLLKNIPGIGSILAGRIIKFRSALGGFHSVEQLNEVYGLKDNALLNIKTYAEIQSSYRKIEINQTNFIRHPYLSNNQAAAIISYRKQHGDYNDIDDLRKIKILNEETINKIEPYINFESK